MILALPTYVCMYVAVGLVRDEAFFWSSPRFFPLGDCVLVMSRLGFAGRRVGVVVLIRTRVRLVVEQGCGLHVRCRVPHPLT